MMPKNKWFIAVAGMTLQLSIGSIYAYSVWIKPIQSLNGWDPHQLKLAFSLAICFLGFTAAFMGRFVQKIGPKKAGLLAALFFGTGLAGAGFASSIGSLPFFYLTYGVVSGIGLGFGYITPVSIVVKWFPEKPGLGSGLVIMSFATGSILASQIITPLTHTLGVSGAFYLLAIVYTVLMVFASLYLEAPAISSSSVTDYHSSDGQVFVSELLTDIKFYALWLMLFLNTTCGIALIAVAAPMAKDVIHIDEKAGIAFVGIIGLFNGVGRLVWSSISDKAGRWGTFLTFFLTGAVCFVLLTQTSNAYLFQILVFVIISCYGGAFATMPAFIKDIYGADKLGPVFGYVLIAWSVAAFAGPWLISLTNNYSLIFFLFAGLLSFAAIMSILLKSKLKPVAYH